MPNWSYSRDSLEKKLRNSHKSAVHAPSTDFDKSLFYPQMIIPNLTMNSVYEIVVRGGTRSAIDNRLIIRGEGSAPQKVRGIRDCNRAPPLLPHSTIWFSSGVIAGVICACLAVMLMITSFVLWKWGSIVCPRFVLPSSLLFRHLSSRMTSFFSLFFNYFLFLLSCSAL